MGWDKTFTAQGILDEPSKFSIKPLRWRTKTGFPVKSRSCGVPWPPAVSDSDKRKRPADCSKGADESCRDAFGESIRAAVLLPYAAFGDETGRHAQALALTEEIGRCTERRRDVAVVQQALAIRSRSLFSLGRCRKAYRTAQEADRLKDSLRKETNARKIKELESKQQDLAKAREMEALNHEIH